MATKLTDYLFIGDAASSQDPDFIIQNRVSRIINCAGKQLPNVWENDGMRYLTFVWEDSESYILFDGHEHAIVSQIKKFIDEAKSEGESVLIHSVRGTGRCAICAACYFMCKFGWGYRKTFQFMIRKRYDLDPNQGFIDQLALLDKRMTLKRLKGDGMLLDKARHDCWEITKESTKLKNSRDLYRSGFFSEYTESDEEEAVLTNSYLNSDYNMEKIHQKKSQVKLISSKPKIRWSNTISSFSPTSGQSKSLRKKEFFSKGSSVLMLKGILKSSPEFLPRSRLHPSNSIDDGKYSTVEVSNLSVESNYLNIARKNLNKGINLDSSRLQDDSLQEKLSSLHYKNGKHVSIENKRATMINGNNSVKINNNIGNLIKNASDLSLQYPFSVQNPTKNCQNFGSNINIDSEPRFDDDPMNLKFQFCENNTNTSRNQTHDFSQYPWSNSAVHSFAPRLIQNPDLKDISEHNKISEASLCCQTYKQIEEKICKNVSSKEKNASISCPHTSELNSYNSTFDLGGNAGSTRGIKNGSNNIPKSNLKNSTSGVKLENAWSSSKSSNYYTNQGICHPKNLLIRPQNEKKITQLEQKNSKQHNGSGLNEVNFQSSKQSAPEISFPIEQWAKHLNKLVYQGQTKGSKLAQRRPQSTTAKNVGPKMGVSCPLAGCKRPTSPASFSMNVGHFGAVRNNTQSFPAQNVRRSGSRQSFSASGDFFEQPIWR